MYLLNLLSRPVLITPDEVIAKSATASNPDVRMILQNIELAEERFLVPSLGIAFYDDFCSKKNVQITSANQASKLALINSSRATAGRAPIFLTDIPVGTWVNAIELVTDPMYVLLWNRYLWRLTAECVDMMCTVPSWLQHTAQGQIMNKPAIIGSSAESASGTAKDVKFKMDVQIQSRIEPFRESMEKWICAQQGVDPASFQMYCKCACNEYGSPVAAKRNTQFVLGIYDRADDLDRISAGRAYDPFRGRLDVKMDCKTPAPSVSPPPPASGFAYWLARDTNTPPTDSEIISLGVPVAITTGQPAIIYDLTGLASDKWLFLCEPIGEPVKTYKYCSVADQEYLGPDGQFGTRLALTTFAYYPSNFPTSSSTYPIQLKTTP